MAERPEGLSGTMDITQEPQLIHIPCQVIPTKPLIKDAITGGWGGTLEATEETQKICDQVRRQVEERVNNSYAEFRAVTYRSQTVNGYKILIKVHVGGEGYIHLSIYQSCHQELPPELRGVHEHKTIDDLL